MSRLTGHTSVWSSKRVKAYMQNGMHFIAKFKEKKGGRIYFFDHEPVKTIDVRTLTIWKGKELHI